MILIAWQERLNGNGQLAERLILNNGVKVRQIVGYCTVKVGDIINKRRAKIRRFALPYAINRKHRYNAKFVFAFIFKHNFCGPTTGIPGAFLNLFPE
ncbi:Uncharacterised protein [Klebsiella pneumoniae]|nr:Uncharacterised protein [Klebsiella pneumoniae]SWJ11878.1 Uncharacterised protein [Klebsiella pneumoniae]